MMQGPISRSTISRSSAELRDNAQQCPKSSSAVSSILDEKSVSGNFSDNEQHDRFPDTTVSNFRMWHTFGMRAGMVSSEDEENLVDGVGVMRKKSPLEKRPWFFHNENPLSIHSSSSSSDRDRSFKKSVSCKMKNKKSVQFDATDEDDERSKRRVKFGSHFSRFCRRMTRCFKKSQSIGLPEQT